MSILLEGFTLLDQGFQFSSINFLLWFKTSQYRVCLGYQLDFCGVRKYSLLQQLHLIGGFSHLSPNKFKLLGHLLHVAHHLAIRLFHMLRDASELLLD